MKITAIKPVKGKKKHCALYIDGKFFMNFNLVTLEQAGIYQGKKITEKQLKDLIGKNSLYKAKEYAGLILSYRPRSCQELKNKMLKKGFAKDLSKKVLESMKKKGVLNDEKFTRWWIKQRRKGRPKGDFGIKQELKNKGINSRIIDRALNDLAGADGMDKIELAWQAARPMLKKYRRLPENTARRRLISLLKRRGFSWEIINKVVEKFFK